MLQKYTKLFAKHGILRPFRLLSQDAFNFIRRYPSDWTIFNQIVIASAILVFFTNLLPGITFASDLYASTGQNWGTIEIVFSTGLCNVTSALFGLQPLTILGVTGSFTVLAENIYDLCTNSFGIEFLPFTAWSLIHACWILWLLAIFNAHEWTMLYVTDFTCEIFSLLNSIIYFHKAFQEFQRGHAELEFDAWLFSIIDGVGTFLLALLLVSADKWAPLFPRVVRSTMKQYATPIAVVFFVAIGYVGDARHLNKFKLTTSNERIAPSSPERTVFFVQFWTLPANWAAIAVLPGAIIATLFFFDHEISTIICTAKTRFGVRKPTGFALDIVILGLTTAICGLLGLPPANGLLPQSPIHSQSLLYVEEADYDHARYVEEDSMRGDDRSDAQRPQDPLVQNRVHEQRWSKLLHAIVIISCMAPPLQRVLGFTPTSVLAGLFIFMGQQSLSANPILRRFFHILTPTSQLPALASGIPSYWSVHSYTLFQVVAAIVVFIITLTPAAPAFVAIVTTLVPFRLLAMPRIWNHNTLRCVDRWSCRDGTPEDCDDDQSLTSEMRQHQQTIRLIPSLALSGFRTEGPWGTNGDRRSRVS